MFNFIHRIISWNQLRTQRLHDVELRNKMLLEEACEACEAYGELERLMASGEATNETIAKARAHLFKELFDVIFVASGTMWVDGLDEVHIYHMLEICLRSNESRPARRLNYGEKGEKGPNFKAAEPELTRYLLELNK